MTRRDHSVPFVMLVAGVVCAVLSTVAHEPRPLFKHVVSLEHMGWIAVMWFALVGATVAQRTAVTWWSLRRLGATASVRRRWSVGNLVGTTLLAAFVTAQLTAI